MGLTKQAFPVRDKTGINLRDSVPVGVSVGDALRGRDLDAHMLCHLRLGEDGLPMILKWKTPGDIAIESCRIPEQDGDYSIASLIKLVAGWLRDQVG